jgi:uncharacterized membrane protein
MTFLNNTIPISNNLLLKLILIPIYHVVSSFIFIKGVKEVSLLEYVCDSSLKINFQRNLVKIMPYVAGTFFMFFFVMGVHLTVWQQIYNPRLWFLVVYWVSCSYVAIVLLKDILMEEILEKTKNKNNELKPNVKVLNV